MRAKFAETDVVLRHSDDAFRAEVGETAVVLHVLSIDPPHARVTLDGVEKTVTFVIGRTIHLARGGASYSLDNTVQRRPGAPPPRATAGWSRR